MAITPRTRPPLLDQRLPQSPPEPTPPPQALPPPSAPTPLWQKWFVAPLLASLALLAFVGAHLGSHGHSFHKRLPQDVQAASSFAAHMKTTTVPPTEEAGIHRIPKIDEDEGSTNKPDRCLLHPGQKDEFKQFRDNICTSEYTRVTRKNNFPNTQVKYMQRRYNKKKHETTFKYNVCSANEDGVSQGEKAMLIHHLTFGDRGNCCLLSTKYYGATFLESKVDVGVDKKTCTYGSKFVEPLTINPQQERRCEVYELTYLGFVPKFHVRVAVHPGGDRYFAQRVTGAYCSGSKWHGFEKVPKVDFDVDWDYGNDGDPNTYVDNEIYSGPGAVEEGGEAPWSTTGDDKMLGEAEDDGSNSTPGQGTGGEPDGSNSTPGQGTGGEPEHVEVEKKDWEKELEGDDEDELIVTDRIQGQTPPNGEGSGDGVNEGETEPVDSSDEPITVEAEEEKPTAEPPIIVPDASDGPIVVVTDDQSGGRPIVVGGGGSGGGGGGGGGRPIIVGGGGGGSRPIIVGGGGGPTIPFDPIDHGFKYDKVCNPIKDVAAKSSFGQDEAIYEIYFTNPHTCGGTVVEVGRSNGVTSSSSYFFEYALNWRAINIVANPNTFSELAKNRPHAMNVNGAFCENVSRINFKDDKFYLPPGSTGRASEELERSITPSGGEEVDCVSLTNVFHERSVARVDVMYINVDGDVVSVLNTMNWNVRVLIWVIEIDPQSADYGDVADLLRKHNYVKAEWDIMRWCEIPSQCMLNEVWLQKGYNPRNSRRKLQAVSRRLRLR